MDRAYVILVVAAFTSHAGTLKPAKRHDVLRKTFYTHVYMYISDVSDHFRLSRIHVLDRLRKGGVTECVLQSSGTISAQRLLTFPPTPALGAPPLARPPSGASTP